MRTAVLALTLGFVAGCTSSPRWYGSPAQPVPVVYNNPLPVPIADHHFVWENVRDVVNDYFRIDHEEPVRAVGNSLTEGRMETFPKNGATLFEPWDEDSVNAYERLESTLQSIRRRAVVRVIPFGTGGFQIEVVVYKDLENVSPPENSTAGAATFRTDQSLTRVINPDRPQDVGQGWISQGRDTALEQQILGELQGRFFVPQYR